jgi:hypothetical protein
MSISEATNEQKTIVASGWEHQESKEQKRFQELVRNRSYRQQPSGE